MKFTSRDWLYVTGKAYSGKSTWIREHIKQVPEDRLYIFDYTNEDYKDWIPGKAQVYQATTGSMEEIEAFLTVAYNRGNCTVVLSESDNYLRYNSPVLRQFVTTGRNRGINAIVDGKRPVSVPPSYRGRFNYLVLFQTTLGEDIKYLEEWAGLEKGRLEILRELDLGEHIIINLDKQEISSTKKLKI